MPSHNPYILAIETSCDETAISALFGMEIKSHKIHSQADLHAEFGGVFPNLAKREHSKNIIPLLSLVFSETCGTPIYQPPHTTKGERPTITIDTISSYIDTITLQYIKDILHREPEALHDLLSYIQNLTEEQFLHIKNTYTAIAVTYGPGLEPALWVGISVAKALAVLFDLPLYPINHMEGHIASVLSSTTSFVVPSETSSNISSVTSPTTQTNTASSIESLEEKLQFPAIALLISGGHTELVQLKSWHAYTLLGKTVDDAVGEAYDKVARLIGLSYPGGPAISRLAASYRQKQQDNVDQKVNEVDKPFILPRPMLHTKDFNFSFSGLKTAVLYAVKNKYEELAVQELDLCHKEALASEFEDAVTEVLLHKTNRAVEETGAKHLVIGGGVIANTHIRSCMTKLCQSLDIKLSIPEFELTTDNASMIGLVAYLQIKNNIPGIKSGAQAFTDLKADGNLSL